MIARLKKGSIRNPTNHLFLAHHPTPAIPLHLLGPPPVFFLIPTLPDLGSA
jgi:hypothetical protein